MTKEDPQRQTSPAPIRRGLPNIASRNILQGSSTDLFREDGLVDVIAIIDAAIEIANSCPDFQDSNKNLGEKRDDSAPSCHGAKQ